VAAGAAGRRGGRGVGIGVEATVLAQAHQGRHARLAQVKRQLHRVIAGVEDEQGDRAVGGQGARPLFDLRRRHAVRVLAGAHAPHIEGRRPAIAGQAQVVEPRVGPTRDDGLACRVARRVVVVAPRGAGLGVATRPDAVVDGVDRRPVGQRVARQEVAQHAACHAAMREGRVGATPPATMGRGQAQVCRRGGRARREQRVGELEEGVGAVAETGVCVGATCPQGGEGGCRVHRASLAHLAPFVELKRKPSGPSGKSLSRCFAGLARSATAFHARRRASCLE